MEGCSLTCESHFWDACWFLRFRIAFLLFFSVSAAVDSPAQLFFGEGGASFMSGRRGVASSEL